MPATLASRGINNMARRRSYDLSEGTQMAEDNVTENPAVGFDKKEATIQLRRHMSLGNEVADWHPVTVTGSAEISSEDPSNYQNLEYESEQVEGIVLNEEEMDLLFQALGIAPVTDTMSEEEHDAALAAEEEQEEI
jgi:hypothetical protein